MVPGYIWNIRSTGICLFTKKKAYLRSTYWSQLKSHLASGGTTVFVVHEFSTFVVSLRFNDRNTATPPAAPTATAANVCILDQPVILLVVSSLCGKNYVSVLSVRLRKEKWRWSKNSTSLECNSETGTGRNEFSQWDTVKKIGYTRSIWNGYITEGGWSSILESGGYL